MSTRRKLATVLRDGLPEDHKVIPYPTNDPGPAAKPVIVAYQESIKTAQPPTHGAYEVGLVVWIVTSGLTSKAEDQLEAALWRVLGVLDAETWLILTTADRVTFGDTHEAYRLSLTAYANKE